MNREQLDRYRKQLQEIVNRVARTAAGLEEQVRTPLGGEAAGGMSNAPLHLGDLGSEAFTQELDATLLENERYIQQEAVAAMARIDRGTYGRCESCGGDIASDRLDAIPYARHCAACAARAQAGRAVNVNEGRPPEWLGPPGYEGLTANEQRVVGRELGADPDDHHAAGTPGGGTSLGGLAGTNVGGGSPEGADLDEAMGSGTFDLAEAGGDTDEDEPPAAAGPAGGAVGGTPANKRAKGKTSGKATNRPGKGKSKRPKRSSE
jgi:RNA polymerase-binding transcription factor DksA